ncbi:hypothetical protein D3C71_1670210 [compost metagenome]
MVMAMPLDLVALVRCFFGRDCANSKANLSTRSTPWRDITVSCITISRGVPSYMRPPMLEYSPSVFSRTMNMSISPGCRGDPSRRTTGAITPGMRRAGRRLMYWSNSRRNKSSEPHSETWSAIFSGQPTAPK